MGISMSVLASLKSHDWPRVERYLSNGPASTLLERLTDIVETLLREGLLTSRHPNRPYEEGRDVFVESLDRFVFSRIM